MSHAVKPLASPPPWLGALEQWRSEMREGKRGNPELPLTWRAGELWKAACREVVARDEAKAGNLAAAGFWLEWAVLGLHGSDDRPDSKSGRALLAELARLARSA